MPGTLKEVLEQKAQMSKRDKDYFTKPQTPRAWGLQCCWKDWAVGGSIVLYNLRNTKDILPSDSAVP